MPRSSSTAVPSKIDNRRQRGASPPRGRIADSSSRKAVSFSSARTTKLDRCDARQQIPNICPPNRRLRTQPPTTVDVAPRSLTVSARRLFREEPPNDASFLLVLDAREQLCPQLSNRFWFIERQLLIHLAALKVTGLAAGLEYRPDVRSESRPFCHCLDRGEGRQENERTHEKKTRNKAIPKHQLNNAPISKTRNADSDTALHPSSSLL
jgi:hypothetical protein